MAQLRNLEGQSSSGHGPGDHSCPQELLPMPRSCYLLFGQFQLLLQELIALSQAPVLLQQGLPNACC